MCFPSVCGEKKSSELEHIEMKEDNKHKDECCIHCPFINICKTCYAENYIMRGSVSRRDTSLCAYQKIVFVVLFKYEYARIMKLESPTLHDVSKMQAIQKWYPMIKLIEENLING